MNAIAHSIWLLTVVVLAGEWVLALPVALAGLVRHRVFHREGTFFVAAPELLMYFFPLILALFLLSVVPQLVGSHSAAGEYVSMGEGFESAYRTSPHKTGEGTKE